MIDDGGTAVVIALAARVLPPVATIAASASEHARNGFGEQLGGNHKDCPLT
jgi:hypothetical protein